MDLVCCVQGVVNRDIKLENTLLDGSRRPLLKICDFGYSKHEKDSLPKSKVGTPGYTGWWCATPVCCRCKGSLSDWQELIKRVLCCSPGDHLQQKALRRQAGRRVVSGRHAVRHALLRVSPPCDLVFNSIPYASAQAGVAIHVIEHYDAAQLKQHDCDVPSCCVCIRYPFERPSDRNDHRRFQKILQRILKVRPAGCL